MTLNIVKLSDDSYEAEITPPHSHFPWKTAIPLRLRELIDELEKHGCHQSDIGDALYEIDPDWDLRLN